MRAIKIIEGRMVPIDRADVDTDQILPARFLTQPERSGFDRYLFHYWMDEPGFVLRDPRYRGANILVGGPNFGCGSSREHAPWGLEQYGFQVIVAPSFGEIFRPNCTKIGLLCAQVSLEDDRRLLDLAAEAPQTPTRVDLAAQSIVAGGLVVPFEIDAFSKWMLGEGLDHIEVTLRQGSEIADFENRRLPWYPNTAVRPLGGG